MKRRLLSALAFLAAVLGASSALAGNCSNNPYTLTNGSTADATQVMANFNNLLSCANSNLAHNGSNSDITSLNGLTTPISAAQGGTGSTNGNAVSATKLFTARTFGMTGDVVWTSPAFDGTGNVTAAGTIQAGAVTTADLAAGAVTMAKIANIGAGTILGNNTGGSTAPIALTATQATAMLNAVVGDSGSGGTAGLVPAPPAGSAAAGKFLSANGTFTSVGTVPVMFYATISGGVATVNGTGVSSMTYSGANAKWTVTLSNARPSANFAVVCTATQGAGGAEGVQEPSGATRTTTTFQLQFFDTSPAFVQPTAVSCMVGGG